MFSSQAYLFLPRDAL